MSDLGTNISNVPPPPPSPTIPSHPIPPTPKTVNAKPSTISIHDYTTNVPQQILTQASHRSPLT
ncbi:hypothetical protein IQ07DRAFT_587387 [Pyrenochaeta sp. DS3sAY3a]|nr:hypothetical protein IQ07DRAFT_587387 [Pyrenochaeta sp. DS3sAY3a]